MNVNVLSTSDVREIVRKELIQLMTNRKDGVGRVLRDVLRGAKIKLVSADTSVHDIGLSVRASNVLNNWGRTTVSELATYSESDIRRCRNAGKNTVSEIALRMAMCGWPLNRVPRWNAAAGDWLPRKPHVDPPEGG